MKRLGTSILILTIIFAASCINQTTITGNPPPVPVPTDTHEIGGDDGGDGGDVEVKDLAALAAAELARHPLWKGNFLAKFADGVVNVYDIASYEHFSSAYTIRSDGFVIADDLDPDRSLIAFLKEDSETLDMRIVSESGSVIDTLTATDSEEYEAALASILSCIAMNCTATNDTKHEINESLYENGQDYMDNAPGGKYNPFKIPPESAFANKNTLIK